MCSFGRSVCCHFTPLRQNPSIVHHFKNSGLDIIGMKRLLLGTCVGLNMRITVDKFLFFWGVFLVIPASLSFVVEHE